MKKLATITEMPEGLMDTPRKGDVFMFRDGEFVVSSLTVAELYDRSHTDIIGNLDNLRKSVEKGLNHPDYPDAEFKVAAFELSPEQVLYTLNLNRDAFGLVTIVMGSHDDANNYSDSEDEIFAEFDRREKILKNQRKFLRSQRVGFSNKQIDALVRLNNYLPQ